MTTELLSGLRSAVWLDQQTFPPLQWMIPGIVPEGFSLLVGGPKMGKSWMSLDFALAVASGGKALGKVPVGPARPVLLMALEDGDRRLQERMRKLTLGRALPNGLDYLTDVKPALVVDTIEAWMERLPNCGPAPLVILDTLGKAMPPTRSGESGYVNDYLFTASLKRIVDDWPGSALLALHHDRKMGADDFVQQVSGTNGIAGAADSILLLARKRQEADGIIRVTGRDVDEDEYALHFDGQWTVVGDNLAQAAREAATRREQGNLGDDQGNILRHVNAHPEGVRAADVAEALDIDADKAGKYLRRLAESGRITKTGRGIFTPSETTVRSVRSVRTEEGRSAQTDTTDTSDTFFCTGCGEPLHPSLVAAGDTMHMGCSA
ncbi:AAA family ATPase [Raineyella fluvialis]|uniref:AAA family ATPase n=1 Tax=Raineyella fluvialis TaxID=2662261 RepID=A0A5Q2FHV3_9ACTN|nr:AAA family ATPase [Raineyella fluvialis]QGF24743.1 AAA family ATPase [Raineyella fluvialis]